MLFKYFLDYLPEEVNLIDPSLLTVFRRERLSNKDNEENTSANLMDKLISKTVEIALKEGLIQAKNAELKSNFGYDTANAYEKTGITIQGASALFLANIKRIIKLKEEKTQKKRIEISTYFVLLFQQPPLSLSSIFKIIYFFQASHKPHLQ